MKEILDSIIIGGGPAGLNAALVLGRARRNVAVIDAAQARNRVTQKAHNFLTREGISPGEFRRIAKEQISAFPSVQFVEDTATSIEGSDGSFQVTTAEGLVLQAKKILFAVGKKDLPLDLNGLSEVYGKTAFVCPYCDGWELRDQPLVLIVNGARALHLAQIITGWTSTYTICTNGPGEMTDEQRHELQQHGVPVYESPVQRIESQDGIVQRVVLQDGNQIECRGVFFAPKLSIGSDLPQSLGCEVNELGTVIVDERAKTTVPGVFSAGDAASEYHQAIAAASLGALSAVSINSELAMEAWNKQGNE